jgi:hypothetical protein
MNFSISQSVTSSSNRITEYNWIAGAAVAGREGVTQEQVVARTVISLWRLELGTRSRPFNL